MAPHDDDSPDVDAILQNIAQASSTAPDWQTALAKLTADSPADERLAVYRSIRDSGWLSDDEGFYLVCSFVEEMADGEAATTLADLDRRLDAKEAELAVAKKRLAAREAVLATRPAKPADPDGDPSPHARALPEDDPTVREYDRTFDEREQLADQFQIEWDAIFLANLAACGETEIAAVYMNDREDFAYRYDIGLQSFQAVDDRVVSPDDLISVTSCLDPTSAELARNELAKQGIPAAVGNANFVSWYWHYSNATGGVTVDVRRGDAQRARNALAAIHAKSPGLSPPWICPACGQKIPGEWEVCWHCGASPDGAAEIPAADPMTEAPVDDAESTAPRYVTKVFGAAAFCLLVLLPLAFGYVVPALFFAPLVLLLIFLMERISPEPKRSADTNFSNEMSDAKSPALPQASSSLRSAQVRRAWQAAVIAALAFPPLGFYSLWLASKLLLRDKSLIPADLWRVIVALFLSVAAILFCALFAIGFFAFNFPIFRAHF